MDAQAAIDIVTSAYEPGVVVNPVIVCIVDLRVLYKSNVRNDVETIILVGGAWVERDVADMVDRASRKAHMVPRIVKSHAVMSPVFDLYFYESNVMGA